MNIVNKIKQCQNIQPNEAWRASLKRELLAEIESRALVPEPGGFWLFCQNFSRNYIFSFQHAYVPVMIFLLMIFSGSVFATQIAKNSLPGEWLYKLKIASEKAQVSITLNENGKVRKEVGFAARRLAELNTTLKRADQEAMKAAAESFHQEIAQVQARFEVMNKKSEENSSQAVEIAKMVDKKTIEFEEMLTEAANKVPPDVRPVISSALNTLGEVNFKALGIIIEEQALKEKVVDEKELIAKLEKRIEKIEKRINSLGTDTSEPGILEGGLVIDDVQGLRLEAAAQIQTAKVFLQEARELLENSELKMALEKMEKSNGLAAQIEGLARPELGAANDEEITEIERSERSDTASGASGVTELDEPSEARDVTELDEEITEKEAQNIQSVPEIYPQAEEKPETEEKPDFYGGLIQNNSANDSQIQGGIWKTKKIVP